MPFGQRREFFPDGSPAATQAKQAAALKKATAKKEAEIKQRGEMELAAFGPEAARTRQERRNEFIRTSAARAGGGNQLVTQRFSDGSFNSIGRNNPASKSGSTALALGLINIGGNTAAAIPANEATTFDRIAPVAQSRHNQLNRQLLGRGPRPAVRSAAGPQQPGSQPPAQAPEQPVNQSGGQQSLIPPQSLEILDNQLLRRRKQRG